MNDKRRWWLYILTLENSKWYVGITSKTPAERFAEHLAGTRAAYWTIEHKPLEIELVEDLGVVSRAHAEKYESKVTRDLMKERGLNNVRGGDLRGTKDYIKLFGYIFDRESMEDLFYIIILFTVTLSFFVDKYIVRFIPGGV